jgi:hypothetical protein
MLQKSVAFLYTNNEQIEKEHIYNSLQKIGYLVINLTEDISDLYMENYKSLKKEIEEDYKGGNISHAHGLAEST